MQGQVGGDDPRLGVVFGAHCVQVMALVQVVHPFKQLAQSILLPLLSTGYFPILQRQVTVCWVKSLYAFASLHVRQLHAFPLQVEQIGLHWTQVPEPSMKYPGLQ
jgi:hypothetical protein